MASDETVHQPPINGSLGGLPASAALFAIVAILLIAVGCQPEQRLEEETSTPAQGAMLTEQSATEPSVAQTPATPAERPAATTTIPPTGNPTPVPASTAIVPSRITPPVDIQDFVDRSHVIVIGTVSGVEGPVEDLGYSADNTYLEFIRYDLENSQHLPSITMTYYELELEEIVLDDGNIGSNAFVRMHGTPDSYELQVGDRLLFAMSPNPDFRSYSPDSNWGMIFLDGSELRYFNGRSLPFEGVSDEESLVDEIEAALPGRVTTPPSVRWNPQPGEGQWDGAVGRRTIWSGWGGSDMAMHRSPLDTQDYVNRAEAIVVGRIIEIGDLHVLGWEDPDPDLLEKLAEAGVRPQGLAVTDYLIEVESSLLDDGGVSSTISLRLLGIHSPRRPQIGERFLFSLRVDHELRSYGACCDWNLIVLDDGPLRYLDDEELAFDGVSDEESLILSLESALENWEQSCPENWPKRPGFETNERDC